MCVAGGGGYSNMKLVYICRALFKNGGLKERPLTENKARVGVLSERPLTGKTGDLGVKNNKETYIFSSPEPSGSQGELIVYPYSGVRVSSLLSSSSSTMFKHLLLRNRFANQSQILCGASLGRGNESLYKWSRSHDQDGHHAHIW